MSPAFRKIATMSACGALALTAGLGAAAAQDSDWVDNPSTSTKACFQVKRIDGFAVAGRNLINISAGSNDVYQMRFITECWTLDQAKTISVQPRNGVTNFICTGSDAEVVTQAPGLRPQHCVANGLRKLSPAEIASLPPGQRP